MRPKPSPRTFRRTPRLYIRELFVRAEPELRSNRVSRLRSLDPQLVSFSFFSDASYAAVRLLRLEGTLCKTTSQFAIAFFLSPTAV